MAAPTSATPRAPTPQAKNRRSRWRIAWPILLITIAILIGFRAVLPIVVRGYVNRTIDQHPMYDGQVGDIDIYLWRGGYTIKDVRILKTTGNIPVPLFAAKR